jgi:sodium pump decarboxylase gamma subunit
LQNSLATLSLALYIVPLFSRTIFQEQGMTLIEQGFIITATGMSVVFIFLGILVCVTKILSLFFARFFPEHEEHEEYEEQDTLEAELAIAIAMTAAISNTLPSALSSGMTPSIESMSQTGR